MQKIVMLRVDQLHPHPANPRKDLGDLTELADSIKAKGVLQNLTVVPYYSTVHKRVMEGLYTIIIGHRRHAASKLAGLKELPCVITEMTDEEQIDTMAIENLQRSDLTAYEQAEHFQLMLDMGRTVQQVAERTGFSETTIRNRVKLTKLDKAKFKKAEARGVTMADFLKLNEIQNEERRNTLLESIGTSDFNQRYKAAKQAEKDEKWFQDTVTAFRAADWCEEITKNQRDELTNSHHIGYVHNYGPWNKREVVKPDDAGDGKHGYLYFYVVCDREVDLYREVKKADSEPKAEEIDPVEAERRATADEISELLFECQEMDQGFRDLREDFIDTFDKYNTYREEIMAFAVKAWLFRDKGNGYQWNPMVDREELAGMLNIELADGGKEVDMKALEQRMRGEPERVLLTMAYLMLEDGNRGYTTTLYDNTVKCSLPKHKEDKQLDLLYECLRSLGYDWSEAEQKASVGDLPQFQEAERLVKEFNEEVGNG